MYACVCVVVVVGGSRRSTVRVNVSFFPWMLIPPYREDIPAGRVCHVLCIPSQRPTQTPTLSKNSKEIPLSCCFTRWTSVIVAEFPPRHWSSHALTHPSIHQECQRGTNRTKKKTEESLSLLRWLYLHGGGWDTRMRNVAGLHLAPCQHAVQTFMKQHFEYYFFFTTLNFS